MALTVRVLWWKRYRGFRTIFMEGADFAVYHENDELLDLQMYDQFAGRFIMDKESCRILLSFLHNEMQTCPELSTIFPTVNGWQVKLARRNVVFVAVDQEARVRRAVENYQLANAVKFEGTITLNNGMCIVPLDSLRFYGQSIDHYGGRGAERMNHLAIDHEGEEYHENHEGEEYHENHEGEEYHEGVPPVIDLPSKILSSVSSGYPVSRDFVFGIQRPK